MDFHLSTVGQTAFWLGTAGGAASTWMPLRAIGAVQQEATLVYGGREQRSRSAA